MFPQGFLPHPRLINPLFFPIFPPGFFLKTPILSDVFELSFPDSTCFRRQMKIIL